MHAVTPSNYPERDYEVVDYRMARLPVSDLEVRGPLPDLAAGNYITCIGAAQTFGCFCEKPWPTIVGESIGAPVLNLGFGGAGPEFFLNNDRLIELANGGQATVIQVMSGRVASNMFLEGNGRASMRLRRSGRIVSADNGWRDIWEGFHAWKRLPAFSHGVTRRFSQTLARYTTIPIATAQSRGNWTTAYKKLLHRITTPKCLLWFSRRQPDDAPSAIGSVEDYLGEFPHLVNSRWLQPVIEAANEYTEVVTDRGTPQILKSRFTGEPISIDMTAGDDQLFDGTWSENSYYPTPEMNVDAARALEPVLHNLYG